MSVVRATACRLCDSQDLDLVVSFTPTPIGDHYVTADKAHETQPCYPLDVLCCRACGAVQLADTVDPKLIYPDTYLYTTSVSKGLDRYFEAYAADVCERLKPRPGSLVVDIGSNDGTLLGAFQRRGFEVWGVEPSSEIAAKANARGIQTLSDWFTRHNVDYMFQPSEAQIITANHVFANVADLHDFTEGVKHLLAPDGTFVFETGYWPAIVDHNLIDTIEHEHIHYFAVKPLAKFFARHGLELVYAEQNRTKGGSLRGYVRHAHVRLSDVSESIAGLIQHERGYTDSVNLLYWADSVKKIAKDMRVITELAAANGETWVGYGAAVGSTLLLHQFGLGEKLTCLVDANPAKQGRLSPGYHLPVYSPEKLAELQPDCIVILAWRYAEMIMAQHPEFAGKWLIPLPEVRTA